MKKVFYSLIFFTSLSFSQGINLELNQVIYLSYTDLITDEIFYVPEGKIWKITSCAISSSSSAQSFHIWGPNGENTTSTVRTAVSANISNHTPESNPVAFPIWLPEGWGVQKYSGVYGFSILEFNAE